MKKDAETPNPSPAPKGLSEDWLATILGLVLLLLAIAGIIPTGVIP
jgi:hypothetical protein